MSEQPKKLEYCVNGEWLTSKTETYMDCYNPSTGGVIARAPQCTAEEVESAVAAAKAAYPGWSNTSVVKRVQVLYRLKTLLEKHLNELTEILATEMGKAWEEAKGDVLKVIEVVEFACGMPYAASNERRSPDGLQHRLRYDYVSSFGGCFRRHRPLEFSCDDPAGLDGADLYCRGKLFRTQSRQFCSSNIDADHGTVVRGRAS